MIQRNLNIVKYFLNIKEKLIKNMINFKKIQNMMKNDCIY